MPILLTLLTVPFGLVMLFNPLGWWRATAWMSFRDPYRVEPSARQLRFWQVSAVVMLVIGTAFPLALYNTRAAGWLGLALAILMLVMMVRAFNAPEVRDYDLPPNEPAPLQYGIWTIAFVVLLGATVVLSFKAVVVPGDDTVRERWVEKGRANWEDAFLAELPTWDYAPTYFVHDPWGSFIEVDQERREPSQLFAAAEAIGPRAVAQIEAADLILLPDRDFVCTVTGAVVRERGDEDGTIEVAIVSNEGDHINDCLDKYAPPGPLQAVFVSLDGPLGDTNPGLGTGAVKSYVGGGGCDRPRLVNIPGTGHLDDCDFMIWNRLLPDKNPYFDPIPQQLVEREDAACRDVLSPLELGWQSSHNYWEERGNK